MANNVHLRTMGDYTYQTIFSRIWKFSNTISLKKDIILISSFIIKNTNCCLMSMKLKFGTMNNLILSLFILNKLQSRRKCGSSSILRQVLHSRFSLLSFLYRPLSISVCNSVFFPPVYSFQRNYCTRLFFPCLV